MTEVPILRETPVPEDQIEFEMSQALEALPVAQPALAVR